MGRSVDLPRICDESHQRVQGNPAKMAGPGPSGQQCTTPPMKKAKKVMPAELVASTLGPNVV